eukprot:TRINITY_DN31981_c0_g1_i1.p1 TRINITY_DN31981_c0_g1~~TRINITY_DN31981_c0_g1_i1.p1  ORF type:complete len:295 (+),score=101.79 TRINITY_DN31981_c0_g1_i1:112-996(+)
MAGHPEHEKRMEELGKQLESSGYIVFESDLVLVPTTGAGPKKGLLHGVEVALKTLNDLSQLLGGDQLMAFHNEITTLASLRHPSLVRMLGVCVAQGVPYLVTEYIGGGDLLTLARTGPPLPPSAKISIARSIAAGMAYLHGQGIIHRDLKPSNVLVLDAERGAVKVCKFGLHYVSTVPTMDKSPEYQAPELQSPDHTNKVDVFSFGCLLWELWTRQPLATSSSAAEVVEQIKHGVRKDIPADCTVGPLISQCWGQDPHKRPTFEQVEATLSALQSVAVPLCCCQRPSASVQQCF